MRLKAFAFSILLLFNSASAQRALQWKWTPVPVANANGVKAFRGIDSVNSIRAFYLDVDLNNLAVEVKPAAANGTEPASVILQRVGAVAGINGGFFGSGQALGLVLIDGQILTPPLAALNRAGTAYYATRAAFGLDKKRQPATAWAYNWNGVLHGYPAPNPNQPGAPAPLPDPKNFSPAATPWKIWQALGGGPNLISQSAVNITYDAEVMFGSGVGSDNPDPRTAIGFTAAKHVIMFVVDGRQAASTGLSLPEVAQTLLALGCVEAINLDGGGSSTFVVNGKVLNNPSDGQERRVANVFAVVPADTIFEIKGAKVIDATHLDVSFDYEVDSTAAVQRGNYQFDQGLSLANVPNAVRLDSVDGRVVHLVTTPQSAGRQYTLTVGSVKDFFGRPLRAPYNQVRFTGATPVEFIFDTIDTNYHEIGAGWINTANPGFYGTTPSRLNPVGNGGDYAFWNLHFSFAAPVFCRVFAWWVPASNRATDTPFVIKHAQGTDTVRIDQTTGASRWNEIGRFAFSGSAGERILVSDAAARGQFVVTDAIRLVPETNVAVQARAAEVPRDLALLPNYPNPFQNSTVLSYQLPAISNKVVSLKIYNLLGEEIQSWVQEKSTAGLHQISWDGRNQAGHLAPSGIYLARLQAGETAVMRKILLVR